MNVGGDTVRPAAFAPNVYPTANCAMGASIGIGGVLSAGGSSIDPNCATIEQSKALLAVGDYATAQEVLCTMPAIRSARQRTGQPCAEDRPGYRPVESAACRSMSDPLVRRREGCTD